MTATQTTSAVADNPRKGPNVLPRVVPILVLAVVVLAGARELLALWQQAADELARAGSDLGARWVARAFELAAAAGLSVPRLPELAVLELARTAVEGLLSCLFVLPVVCYASGLVVAVGPLAWVRTARAGTRLPAALYSVRAFVIPTRRRP